MNEGQRTGWLTGALCLAALLCGGWALWPSLQPTPHAPTVTRHDLPTADATPDAAPPATASIRAVGRVRLNTASEADIEDLPGVGPKMAARLIAGRPYATLADVDRVKGVGPKMLAQLAPLVQVP